MIRLCDEKNGSKVFMKMYFSDFLKRFQSCLNVIVATYIYIIVTSFASLPRNNVINEVFYTIFTEKENTE